jgi:DinB superfamily
MSRLQIAIEQLIFARTYTLRMLDAIDPADWFRMPHEGVTHVAWQVGHLAMAEYRLALERLRGARPDDANLISESFLNHFGRDSIAVVEPNPAKNPTPAEIRLVFDRVHEQTLRELRDFSEGDLDTPPLKPHPLCKTKFECLRWCSHHEMIHTGQIGLLRRLLGAKPLW